MVDIFVVTILVAALELHADFEWMVRQARTLGRQVMVRHNLTVQLDGDAAIDQRDDVVAGTPVHIEHRAERSHGALARAHDERGA